MAPQIAISAIMNATAQRTWRTITDTSTWNVWGPSVRAVDAPARYIRQGMQGRILTPAGIWLPFVIKTFEPEHYWDWQVGGLMATGHRVEAIDNKRCRLAFTVPIWAAAYGIVCRLALSRIQRLLG